MTSKRIKIQDVFLNHLRKEKVPVTVFLLNGVKLQGFQFGLIIFVFYCAALHFQLVYKHAISTIMPAPRSVIFPPEEDG